MFAELREVVRMMNQSGVTLMAGTDVAGPRVPGFTLHDELALLVEAGLTPLQALQATTLTPARLLNKANDFGTVESGRIADLVLLDANPLDDIRNRADIGRRRRREAFDPGRSQRAAGRGREDGEQELKRLARNRHGQETTAQVIQNEET